MSYPALVNFKAWLGVTGGSEDALLTDVLTGAIEFVEKYCGRVFVASVDETRWFPVARPYVDSSRLRLSVFDDLLAVSDLHNGDGQEITSFYLHPVTGPPFHRIDLEPLETVRFTSLPPAYRVSVKGSWGLAAQCPTDVVIAILEIGKHVYNARNSGSGGAMMQGSRQSGLVTSPAELPGDVLDRLDKWRRRGL